MIVLDLNGLPEEHGQLEEVSSGSVVALIVVDDDSLAVDWLGSDGPAIPGDVLRVIRMIYARAAEMNCRVIRALAITERAGRLLSRRPGAVRLAPFFEDESPYTGVWEVSVPGFFEARKAA